MKHEDEDPRDHLFGTEMEITNASDAGTWNLLYITHLGWNLHPKNPRTVDSYELARLADADLKEMKKHQRARWHTGEQ